MPAGHCIKWPPAKGYMVGFHVPQVSLCKLGVPFSAYRVSNREYNREVFSTFLVFLTPWDFKPFPK